MRFFPFPAMGCIKDDRKSAGNDLNFKQKTLDDVERFLGDGSKIFLLRLEAVGLSRKESLQDSYVLV